jgi:hypothetical protein
MARESQLAPSDRVRPGGFIAGPLTYTEGAGVNVLVEELLRQGHDDFAVPASPRVRPTEAASRLY